METSRLRRCGFCKQAGHDKRTCPAYKSTEYICESTLHNDRGSFTRNVGWWYRPSGDPFLTPCECNNCTEYIKYNLPTPEIACQIIKDQELAKELEKKENAFPHIIVKNETRTPIYIYYNSALHRLRKTLESNEQYTINYKLPFDEDEVDNFTITDHDYGDSINYSVIEPKHMLKLLTMEYGTKETVTITSSESSKEDQWREAALKSQYLLNQLGRLGVSSNPNYEPIMDMVQDISFPEYGEQDKERAGVTSDFTNVHVTTGINDPSDGDMTDVY